MRQISSNPESAEREEMSKAPENAKADGVKASGSQTLQRGLDLLDQVIDEPGLKVTSKAFGVCRRIPIAQFSPTNVRRRQ